MIITLFRQKSQIVLEKETVVGPPQFSGNPTNHIDSLKDKIVLPLTHRQKNHMTSKRQQKLCHGVLRQTSFSFFHASLREEAKSSGPPVKLNVSNVFEKIHFWVDIGEDDHVWEFRVRWVGSY